MLRLSQLLGLETLLMLSVACGDSNGTSPVPPEIGITPLQLDFTGTVGGPAPADQQFTISNVGGGSLQWTAYVELGTFASITPTTGTAPSVLNVSVDPTGLSSGTHFYGIVIWAPIGGGANDTLRTGGTLVLTPQE